MAHHLPILIDCRLHKTLWREWCTVPRCRQVPQSCVGHFIGPTCTSESRVQDCTALIDTLTYKTLHTNTPAYRATLIDYYRLSRTLCTSDKMLLSQPFVKLATASKSFSIGAPIIWNSLPLECRSSTSITMFKQLLKTELFTRAYGHKLPT